jgi:hypothetical protein
LGKKKAQGTSGLKETEQEKSNDTPKVKTMEESLKGKKEIPGLFTLYQDEKEGKLFMLITKEQLNKEYIHFVHGLNGQMNAGVMKGGYRGSTIFTLKRYFNRIEFEVQNNSFYYDPKNPLSKSSDSNISTAILASSNIISEKDGGVLIGVDNLFLTESLHQITRGLHTGRLKQKPF